MKNIKSKLNSNNGVSILFALVLLLVATMVSLIIIVAATSSIKRESSFKESVQRNIDLDSAVLLLKSSFNGSTCSYTLEDENYKNGDCTVSNDAFKATLKEISNEIINNKTSGLSTEFKDAFTISGDYTSNINCYYSISGSDDLSRYTISFKLDNDNVIYCNFNANISDGEITYTYDKSTIKKGN